VLSEGSVAKHTDECLVQPVSGRLSFSISATALVVHDPDPREPEKEEKTVLPPGPMRSIVSRSRRAVADVSCEGGYDALGVSFEFAGCGW